MRNSFACRLTAYIHEAYAASFSVLRCAYPFSPQGSVCTEPAVSLEAVGLFTFGMSSVPAALEKRRGSSVLVCRPSQWPAARCACPAPGGPLYATPCILGAAALYYGARFLPRTAAALLCLALSLGLCLLSLLFHIGLP